MQMPASHPTLRNDRKHREIATGHSTRQGRVSDEWTLVEFRPARWLLTALTVLGLWVVSPKLGVDRVPGTLSWKSDNVTVFLPIGLMLLVSMVGTIVLNVCLRR